jgi:hypothetical protein
MRPGTSSWMHGGQQPPDWLAFLVGAVIFAAGFSLGYAL